MVHLQRMRVVLIDHRVVMDMLAVEGIGATWLTVCMYDK
jgi:hypothetical protein